MKRNDLLKLIRRNGCYLKREGRSHSLWCNPGTGHVEAIPRHTEIADKLANKILKSLSVKRNKM
ncbi:MAG: type II toxin-antitoxin system HicA family toxin [Candidatus Cloacimonetes bacterium]|nr:type II toxin-antitoxin system HicA family toxin [Candidatus Cloacimonadota bacterium]